MAFKVVIDPSMPSLDEQGRPVIIPPDGWEHEDFLNIPGQMPSKGMPGFENTPVKPPSGQSAPAQPAAAPERALQQPVTIPPTGQQITPRAPTPVDIEAQQFEQNMPRPEQFHESRGKRILEAIIAGAAGAAGGPEAGIKVAHELSPYRQALERYEQRRKLQIEPAIARQKEQFEEGTKEAQAKVQQQNVLLDTLKIQDQRSKDLIQAIQKDLELSLQGNKEADLERWRNIQHLDKQDEINKLSPEERFFLKWKSMTPEEQKQFQEYSRAYKGTESDDEKMKLFQKERDYTQKLKKEFEGSPEHRNAIKLESQARAEGATEGRAKLAPSEEKIVNNAFKELQSGADFDTVTRLLSAKEKGELVNRYADASEAFPKHLEQREKSIYDGAKISIGHLNTIQSMFNDPDVKPFIGALAGRVATGEKAIGTIPGATPEQMEKLGALFTMISQTDSWEASVMAGGRPAFRFIQYLKDNLPKITENPALFQGAIDGALISEGNTIRGLLSTNTPAAGSVTNIKVGPPR